MDSIKDFLESVGGHVKERVSSPLAGPFIVSWVVINYKALIVLFSDMKPWVKFGYISNHIWTDWEQTLYLCVGYPLLAALLYILVYPIPLRLVMHASGWHERTTKSLKIKLAMEVPVAREELLEERKRFQDEIDGLQERLDRTTKALQFLRTEKADYDGQLRSVRKELETKDASIAEINAKLNEGMKEHKKLLLQLDDQSTEHRNIVEATHEKLAKAYEELKDVKDECELLQEKLELWGSIKLHPEDVLLSQASPDEIARFIGNTHYWVGSSKMSEASSQETEDKLAKLLDSINRFKVENPAAAAAAAAASQIIPPNVSHAAAIVKSGVLPKKT